MESKYRTCSHTQETSLRLFVKIIGGVMPISGFVAWVTYLVAGTRVELPIVIVIITREGGSHAYFQR